MPARRIDCLLDRLPPVRGRLTGDAPVARMTWFRVGGPADYFIRPRSLEEHGREAM